MKKYLSIILLFLAVSTVMAQEDKKSELYQAIISKDSLLFNVGFNTCDISKFDDLLSERFEFFHDKDGVSNKKDFIHNLRNGLCISPEKYQSRRELLPESTEIFPLYKNKILYGANQTGIHKFYETMAGKKERFASKARFTHLWMLENGNWKLTRSLSYAHQVPKTEVKTGSK
jgi:hypothetical protein